MEADGVVYVDVADRQSGNGFRFYDFEHTVALAMDGRGLEAVAEDLRSRCEIDLSIDQLTAFAEQLAALGFLQPDDAGGTEDLPGFFPPLLADEAGDFSRPIFSSAPTRRTAEPTGGEADKTPAPVAPFSAAKTPAPAPAADRTLTSFPPEVLPVDWLTTPAPEVLPPAAVSAAQAAAPIPGKTPPPQPFESKTPAPVTPPRDPKTPPPFILPAPTAARTPAPVVADPTPAPSSPPLASPAPQTPAPQTAPLPTAAAAAASDLADLPDLPDLADLPAVRSAAAATPAPSTWAPAPPSRETTPPLVLVSPTATPAPVSPSVAAPPPTAMTNQVTTAPFAAESAAVADNDNHNDNRGPDIFSPDFGNEGVPGPASDQTLADFAAPLPSPTGSAETPAPVATAVPVEREISSEAVTPRATQSSNERTEHPTQRLRAVADDPLVSPAGLAVPAPAAAPPRAAAASGNLAGSQSTASGEFSSTPLSAGAAAAPLESPYATPAHSEATSSRGRALGIAFLLVAAAVVLAGMIYRFFATSEPPAVAVEAMVPAPRTIYRYWDSPGRIELAKTTPLAFDSDGRIAEVVAVGTRFGAGDVLAMLDSGKKFNVELTAARERLVYYEDPREKMMAEGNRPELRQAELKIVQKKRMITEAQTSLAKHALIAAEAGEVAEVLVTAGDPGRGGRCRATHQGHRVSGQLRAATRRGRQGPPAGFLPGRPRRQTTRLQPGRQRWRRDPRGRSSCPTTRPLPAGKTVRLARNRLDAVFSVPATALVKVGDSDRLYVVGPNKRAELRVVAVADRIRHRRGHHPGHRRWRPRHHRAAA